MPSTTVYEHVVAAKDEAWWSIAHDPFNNFTLSFVIYGYLVEGELGVRTDGIRVWVKTLDKPSHITQRYI